MSQVLAKEPAALTLNEDVARRLQKTFGVLKAIINRPSGDGYRLIRRDGYYVVTKKRAARPKRTSGPLKREGPDGEIES